MPDFAGNYTLYKSVNPDLSSFHDKQHKYNEGSSWRDDNLQPDQSIECGAGCHFSTYTYAVAFAQCSPHVIISAKVHISDVLAVHRKIRVRGYSDVRIINLDM